MADYASTYRDWRDSMTKREWIKAGCPQVLPRLILEAERSREALRRITTGTVIPFRRQA